MKVESPTPVRKHRFCFVINFRQFLWEFTSFPVLIQNLQLKSNFKVLSSLSINSICSGLIRLQIWSE